MGMKAFPSDRFFDSFVGTAGHAARFEMKVRLFVDAVPALAGSLDLSLAPLTRDILVPWLRQNTAVTEREIELLEACSTVRNKLFHGELSKVTRILTKLGVRFGPPAVTRFQFEPSKPLTMDSMLATLNAGGAPVRDEDIQEGRMFGWLLEAGAGGTFHGASELFDEVADILNRLLMAWSRMDASPAP
jgi:hypothetical protein